MKRITVLCAVVCSAVIMSGIHLPRVAAQNDIDADIASLKAAHERYLAAWSEGDVDTIVDMATGSAGFGHSTAFPRPVRVADAFRAGASKFFGEMDEFHINLFTSEHMIVGDTGVVWGHYAQTSKQKDGPRRTLYLRFTHTFARVDGAWKLVIYHRSMMPSVDTQ